MRVFVDANILVSVLNKEYPLFTYSSRILSLADYGNFEVFTSPICLAIAWYFAEKKYKPKIAREKIKTLCDNISIAASTNSAVQKTLGNSRVNDFEDGVEYYSAVESNCNYIITEDTNDFYFAEIPVLNSRSFFEKYVAKRNK
jgi:predicted nucleic acid-binding protein